MSTPDSWVHQAYDTDLAVLRVAASLVGPMDISLEHVTLALGDAELRLIQWALELAVHGPEADLILDGNI
ncbi:hypothetical protein [Streptomyces sp. NPDC059063]|uniref:hypothetical protein n=1 Tax=unclassified Streptomyces TaxID=2593676 RepID=UPI003680FBEB